MGTITHVLAYSIWFGTIRRELADFEIVESPLKSDILTHEATTHTLIRCCLSKSIVVDRRICPIFDLELEITEAIARHDLVVVVLAIEAEAEDVVGGPRVEPNVLCLNPVLLSSACRAKDYSVWLKLSCSHGEALVAA